ncbi:chorismate mutase [Arcanobacterium ihumii]|uniref:chorismate mutase n=1 Tax=Arcanobacterium ihumii TaxID=2138162 RepID=UPI000F541BB5|nr:chorismate mutase [Arcanobacterium ihumii]
MAEIPRELELYRATIDNLDAALIHILAERFRCTKQVGLLKAQKALPASDPQREARQVERLKRLANETGLDPVFAEKFLRFIVAEVIHHHEDIADNY